MLEKKNKSRDTFAWMKIKYIGWIEDDNQETPLTWSCKIIKFQDTQWKFISVVVDFWLYQWGQKLWELNENIDPEILKADYIIITHAHLDHVWRLPMLTKLWFTGKIFMTPETKALAEISLKDSAKLMLDNYLNSIEQNKRDGDRYRKVKKYVTNLKKLDDNWLKKWVKDKLSQENTNVLNELWEDKLNEFIWDIEGVDGDISLLLWNVIEPLFSKNDVIFLFTWDKWFLLTEPLFDDIFWITDNSEEEVSLKDEDILSTWNVVGTKYERFFETSSDVRISEDLNWRIPKDSWDVHSIVTLSPEQIIKLDFVSSHVWAKDLKETPKIREIFLELFDAWHILWSVQVEFTVRVESILKWDNTQNFWKETREQNLRYRISWDLWREHDWNNAWNIQFPSWEYEFLEVEGTYADKEHPDSLESIQKLFDVLLDSWKHILLPTFALQRTQDTLLLLLDYIEQVIEPRRKALIEENRNYKKDIKDFKKLKKSHGESNNWTENENISDEQFEILETIQAEIHVIQEKIQFNEWEIDRLDITIISDSPLSHALWTVFQVFKPDIYDKLTPESQLERFWKEKIKFLKPKESKLLIDDYKNINDSKKKDRRTKIYVSSGWMCEGGPVVEHLKWLTSKVDSTIIFTWYAPPESLGWKLKTDSQVIIDGEIFNVRSRIQDISWFSWHAWKSTLIKYLNSSAARVTTIVHGWNDRFKLAADPLVRNKKSIKIPAPWDIIEIPFPRSKKIVNNGFIK